MAHQLSFTIRITPEMLAEAGGKIGLMSLLSRRVGVAASQMGANIAGTDQGQLLLGEALNGLDVRISIRPAPIEVKPVGPLEGVARRVSGS